MSERRKPRVSRIWKGVKVARPGDPMKRMMRDHEGVLESIEMILVTAYRADYGVDDRVVAEALHAAINSLSPSDPTVQRLLKRLAEARAEQGHLEDKVWRDALSVVLHSARRHSDCRAASTDYLDFASGFIQ